MRTNATPARKQVPAINFACPTAENGLTALIARLSAAVAEVEKWAPVEDRLSLEFTTNAGPKPKVKGGVTKAQKLISDGEPVLDLPATDWFFHTRESIEESRAKALSEANAAEDCAAIEQRYAALLADWDVQEAAYNSKKPRGLTQAKRMVQKAHRAWSAAEAAIVDYEPKTLTEAYELLAYAGMDGKRVFFMPGEDDLKTIMRNAAAAIALHGMN
ncbi:MULTISPECIES: hypothetical protein [Bradyrhizobium]|uniref:hypothetical protein n=1 Tax=Bradyrhizobium TaxID=374 RepID=UPI0004ACE140|nr:MULTISPECIES: hypothetical protein [Bradyrhizobium]MCA1375704.1 hypothetical protein [Bradyrhizobium sp. IC4060]MCA1485700.1 hypothetical protein [Bradyrhizobium sp. IC4061]